MPEKTLARYEDLFQSVWDNAIDPMRITDAEGTVLCVNAVYSRFAGMPRAELDHQPFWIIYPNERQGWAREQYPSPVP